MCQVDKVKEPKDSSASSLPASHLSLICFPRFESCWPALMQDARGGVIVVSPDLPSHLEEADAWSSCFVQQQQQLLDSQRLLVAHRKPGRAVDSEGPSLAAPLNKLKLVQSSLEEDPEDVRIEFMKYFKSIVNLLNESRAREEVSIIT
ncbi:intraflagellar transport protein 22 homolog isoform X2 [Alligator sinensis]|uniref:Intraflagellar transport protein 22 homolog isoform X2 n=1 Tax=Alligator sinensis TaxID=38654 RepID=A0A3Q0FIY1_ALLSI|nr:intraflagellar transport protein 22 homolog isoform X2 [Alligator sinensis]